MTPLVRSRTICGVTLAVGAGATAWGLSRPPGDPAFYATTALLAVLWLGGAWLARRATGDTMRRAGGRPVARDVGLGLAVGVALCAVFLLGAGLVPHFPALRAPAEDLLAHGTEGATGAVLALTLASGWTEELFFRGAFFDAFAGLSPVITTTLAYALVVAATGIWLLALAAVALGVTTAWLRVRTGGTTAAVAGHLIWSTGMFFLLAPALDFWS